MADRVGQLATARAVVVSICALLLLIVLASGYLERPETAESHWGGAAIRLVAYGDSFTAGGGFDEDRNWATGQAEDSGSVLQRVAARVPDVAGHNAAVPAARMQDLAAQVSSGPEDADIVLLLLGLNDVCHANVTFSKSRFARETDDGFDVLRFVHPGAHVVVYAVPDVTEMREIHARSPEAARLWSGSSYCAGALDPAADPSVVEAARAAFREANSILRAEGNERGFVFAESTSAPGFAQGELSGDFFHPNEEGERRLADLAWRDLVERRPALAP